MNVEQVIELVEKYIADPKSVSYEELRIARDAAWDVVSFISFHAADSAFDDDTDDAKYWVAKYHKNHNV